MLYVILIIILLLFVKSRFLFKLRGIFFYCFHVILVLWFRLSKLTLIQLQESIHVSVLNYSITCTVM